MFRSAAWITHAESEHESAEQSRAGSDFQGVLARERAIHQQRFNKNRKQVWKTHAQLVEMYGSEEVADAVALEKGLDTRT
eukprot:9871521-Alexandrium_andersonii.AAC.1